MELVQFLTSWNTELDTVPSCWHKEGAVLSTVAWLGSKTPHVRLNPQGSIGDLMVQGRNLRVGLVELLTPCTKVGLSALHSFNIVDIWTQSEVTGIINLFGTALPERERPGPSCRCLSQAVLSYFSGGQVLSLIKVSRISPTRTLPSCEARQGNEIHNSPGLAENKRYFNAK